MRAVAADGWLLLCRPGFEAECAAEAADRWRRRGGPPPEGERGEGWVRLAFPPAPVPREAVFRELVFARQGCWLLAGQGAVAVPGPAEVAEQVSRWRRAVPGGGRVLVEAPDGDAGRRLWPRCRRLQESLAGAGGGPGRWCLHLVLLGPGRAAVGVSAAGDASSHPGGIPRLRQGRDAPSRSALKLEEALGQFLGEEAGRVLRPGAAAVDLGAAPGGWSWVLARRGLRVTAVDNGPLASSALATGLVEPVRADGFTYRPERPVEWLVCDMVAPPARVAKLVGVWGRQGLCRRAVFNLKLPSGDRWLELKRCERILRRELGARGERCRLRFKHLYHDREELTGYLELDPAPRGAPGGRAPRPLSKAPSKPGGRRGRREASRGRGGRRR